MIQLRSWLLNGIYVVVLVVASPWIVWAAVTKGKHREGFAAKFFGRAGRRCSSAPCVWLHAVSVGEVNLLGTTLAQLRSSRPDCELVISATTKTGYDLACRKYGAEHTVFYAPLDFSWAVRRAMHRLRPNLLVLAELELWPNLIAAAKAAGAKVAIINGRLSDNSFRGYRRARWLVGPVLRQLDLIACQDATTAERFQLLGASPLTVTVTGSLKYDGAETNRHNPRTQQLRQLASIARDDLVLLAASTQAPEEEMILATYERLAPSNPRLRLIIVPRHPERFDEVARLLTESGHAWQRRSELSEAPAEPSSPPPILLVDTIGELGAWWGVATIGFVGGSFGDRGGQNMIEPAAYGVATSFGPNTWNFRDIVAALLAADAARVVANQEQLDQFVAQCLTDGASAQALGERARAFVATQLGATERTAEQLRTLLPRLDATPIAAC